MKLIANSSSLKAYSNDLPCLYPVDASTAHAHMIDSKYNLNVRVLIGWNHKWGILKAVWWETEWNAGFVRPSNWLLK